MTDSTQRNDLFDLENASQDNTPEIKAVEAAENETAANRKGRPRSEKSRKSILKATNALLLHQSVQELSIEGIAKKAKVGKTTIYRWWPNKTAIVMEALIENPGVQSPTKTPTNNKEALAMQLDKLIRLLNSKNGETIAQLFSEAQGDEKAQKIFEENFLTPLIDAIEFSIEEGKKTDEFDQNMETKLATDLVCGPIFFRLLSRPSDLNERFLRTYPEQAARLISK